ncbi:SGNH/GDSL hydrolase family protein [Neobacillus mesonae]|uniref:SGNH/GDSL hydrolase family protein n=1 Tax=Neobacillus mesonae TaxID=1193713 RepID=UPI002E238E94|nr:SGNH/GDSL hydrolase family protein [Neobacillus mesonae]
MKKILTLLLGVAFLVVLYLGQSHWNEQRQAAAKGAGDISAGVGSKVGEADGSVTGKAGSSEAAKKGDGGADTEKLLALTANWPEKAAELFKVAIDEKKPFKVLFVGSPAIGSEDGEDGPYADVKARLIEAFGKKHIKVNVLTYGGTSTQFLKDSMEDQVAAEAADLVVFEPFILENNNAGVTNNTTNDLGKIVDSVKTAVPDTSFIIQPSYPLYEATKYPLQVANLKHYAGTQGLTYADHWEAWPDSSSTEFKEYIKPDLSPNEKGNKVWSDYLAGFLISDGGSESE